MFYNLKKKHLIICLLLGINLIPTQIANGCAWGYMPEDYRFFLFRPVFENLKELKPFFLSSEKFYGGNFSDDIFRESEAVGFERNIHEWLSEVKRISPGLTTISPADVGEVIYDLSMDELDSRKEELTKSNPFFAWLTKHDSYMDYFRLAKGCELILNNNDPWGFSDGYDLDEAAVERMEKKAAALVNESNEFLVERTWFQVLRLAFYRNDKTKLIAIYKEHFMPEGTCNSPFISGDAYFYYVQLASGDPIELNLNLARAFEKALDKRSRCIQLYIGSLTEETLELAQSDHDKALVLVMHHMQYPGPSLPELKKIRALDPDLPFLDFLIMREVNKLEDWLFTRPLTGFSPALRFEWGEYSSPHEYLKKLMENYLADVAYCDEFIQWLEKEYPNKKPFHQAVLAHLYVMRSNPAKAKTYLAALKWNEQTPGAIMAQCAIDRFLIQVEEAKTSLVVLDICYQFKHDFDVQTEHLIGGDSYYNQALLFASNVLKKQGDLALSLLVLNKSKATFHGDVLWGDSDFRLKLYSDAGPATLDSILYWRSFVESSKKSALTKGQANELVWLFQTDDAPFGMEITADYLYDLKGMYYMRCDSLYKALEAFNHISNAYLTSGYCELFAKDDPFRVYIFDPHNGTKSDQHFYTKKTFVEALIQLKEAEKKETDPEKKALLNYRLGNAYFNMTKHGKYWHMYRLWWTNAESMDYNYTTASTEQPNFKRVYYMGEWAEKYYRKAYQLTRQKELAGLACMMVLTCQHEGVFADTKLIDKSDSYVYIPWQSSLTKELKKRFPKLNYKNLVTDCVLYADYAKRYNPN